jgi:hypothetical protein
MLSAMWGASRQVLASASTLVPPAARQTLLGRTLPYCTDIWPRTLDCAEPTRTVGNDPAIVPGVPKGAWLVLLPCAG